MKTKTTPSLIGAAFLMIAGAVFLTACASPASETEKITVSDGYFTNPLFSNGADPWLEYFDGNYYLTTTTWTSQLVMRKSPTLAGLATATPVNIWSHANPERCCNFWAFEFHRLNGPNGPRWYVMYTSGQHGTLDHQHLSVIESVGDDPMGPYTYKGSFMPDSWNIDGTYLEHDGQLYLLWSEWVGDEQLNWISKMSNPWTITGPRQIITRPTYEWEKSGRKVNEGPEILKKDGRTFMVYSASFCDTPDYKLALMELTGDDPMNQEHWYKFPEPVFQKANGVYGPGHNGFFTSPDGSEDWIVYHGNSSPEHGCGATRSVRAQPFTWTEEGLPLFGEPVSETTKVKVPSGEDGPLVTEVQGAAYKVVSRSGERCLSAANGRVTASCETADNHWVLDPTTNGFIRLANPSTDRFLGFASCGDGDADLEQSAWMNSACQQWRLEPTTDGWWQLINRDNGKSLNVCKTGETGDCDQWRLQPAEAVALSSAQSGRVVEVEACSTKSAANIAQREWDYQDCQKWQFNHIENGYYQLAPVHAPDACMAVANDAVVPGANVEQGSCNSPSSHWRLDLLPGGGVNLINRPSGLALNLASCGLADGTNLALGPVMDSICQRFHLRAVGN